MSETTDALNLGVAIGREQCEDIAEDLDACEDDLQLALQHLAAFRAFVRAWDAVEEFCSRRQINEWYPGEMESHIAITRARAAITPAMLGEEIDGE